MIRAGGLGAAKPLPHLQVGLIHGQPPGGGPCLLEAAVQAHHVLLGVGGRPLHATHGQRCGEERVRGAKCVCAAHSAGGGRPLASEGGWRDGFGHAHTHTYAPILRGDFSFCIHGHSCGEFLDDWGGPGAGALGRYLYPAPQHPLLLPNRMRTHTAPRCHYSWACCCRCARTGLPPLPVTPQRG